MVSIKSFVISTVCILSMVGMSVQEDELGSFIDSTVWPLAFIKNCKYQQNTIDALNKVLTIYHLNGYSCTEAQETDIQKVHKCPADGINLIVGISWPTEFQRQTDLNKKIYAQAKCINMLANGVNYNNTNPAFEN